MSPIGGYFGLEPNLLEAARRLPAEWGLALQSGRGCLDFLLSRHRPEKALLPYFTCDALVAPFREHGIPVTFYGIGEDLLPEPSAFELSGSGVFVFINFFGILDEAAGRLDANHGDRIWFDHTQAFFNRCEEPKGWHFNSARKFFGVPDGGFLRGGGLTGAETGLPPRNERYRTEHLILRSVGMVEDGLPFFRENEQLCAAPARRLSVLSESILELIDHGEVARRRRENYQFLDRLLSASNRLAPEVTRLSAGAVPFSYPFLPRRPVAHELLWSEKIFAPRFWTEVTQRQPEGFAWERELCRHLLPLPVDQRYGPADMERIHEFLHRHGSLI